MKKYTYPILIAVVVVAFYFIEKKLDTDYYKGYQESTSQNTESDGFNYLPTSTTNAIVKHGYYTLSYNEKHEQAEWVAYHLKKEHTAYNNFKRPYFKIDPLVKTNAASWRNYKKSGYDRGHLCPAADRKFDKKAFEETFLTSNISPQINAFNAGIWNNLEKQVRYWVKKEKSLYIVTGPVFKNSTKSIGSEQVTVPTYFYKVIYKNDSPKKMIAFLLPHKASTKPLETYITSVDKLEKLLGIDFFKSLPDTLEDKLESTASTTGWKFIKNFKTSY